MKRETYLKVTQGIKPYKGKHEPKVYWVWRVVGPAGPEEQFKVCGLVQAKSAVTGCYDWEVQDEEGAVVPDRVVFAAY